MEQVINDAAHFAGVLANFLQTETRGIQRILAPVLAVQGHPNVPLQMYPANVIDTFNRQAEAAMMEMIEMEDAVNEMIHRFVHTFLPVGNQMPPQIRNLMIQLMGQLTELRDQLTHLEEFFLNYRHYFQDPEDTWNMSFEEFIGNGGLPF
jgi:hypothetical protein